MTVERKGRAGQGGGRSKRDGRPGLINVNTKKKLCEHQIHTPTKCSSSLTDNSQVDFQIARRRVAKVHATPVHALVRNFYVVHLQLRGMTGGAEERPQPEHRWGRPQFGLPVLAAAHVETKCTDARTQIHTHKTDEAVSLGGGGRV